MQNHSPYTTGTIPVKDRTHYSTTNSASTSDSQLNEYIDCINESDEALEEFIDELRDIDRPVVVLFFGDHQPSLASEYNDASNTDDSDVVHACEEDAGGRRCPRHSGKGRGLLIKRD